MADRVAPSGLSAPPLVTFDVWHTLVYLTPEDEEAYYELQLDTACRSLEKAPLDLASNPSEAPDGRSCVEEELAWAVSEAGRGRTVTPRAQLERAGQRLGRRPDVSGYQKDLADLVARQPFRSAPGAVAALEAIRNRGVRLAVVGNTVGETGVAMRGVLARLGLADFFQAFAFSDELPWAKPAPEIFGHVVNALGGVVGRTLHVGDARSDIEGARRAGLRGAILYTELQQYGPHYRALNVQPIHGDGRWCREVTHFGTLPSAIESMLLE